MTIVLQRAAQDYPAGQNVVPFTVPAASAQYRVTVSLDQWPDNGALSIDVSWGGVFAAGVSFTKWAGVRLDKQGQPITQTYMQFNKPAGPTDGSASITLSALTRTAITVESI